MGNLTAHQQDKVFVFLCDYGGAFGSYRKMYQRPAKRQVREPKFLSSRNLFKQIRKELRAAFASYGSEGNLRSLLADPRPRVSLVKNISASLLYRHDWTNYFRFVYPHQNDDPRWRVLASSAKNCLVAGSSQYF